MFNTTFFGYLTKPPKKVTSESNGFSFNVLSMGIETQNGNKKQYVDVMLDEERFSRILPYLKAGTKLFVTGEILGVNTWLSKEGKPMGTIKISAFKLDFPPKQRKKEDEDSPF